MSATLTERPGGLPPAALAGYSDNDLAEFYGAASADATEWRALLEQEMERRDQADARAGDRAHARAARQHDPVTTEWREMAHAQFLQAERDLCGNLAVTDAPFADAFALWSGTEAWALKYATEELRNWWRDVSPRITVSSYRGQVRTHREANRDEYQLASDAAGPVRQQPQARPVRAVPGRPAGHGRPERSTPGGSMNIAGHIARDAVRGMDRAALRESIRARASQSRGGAPRGHVASEQDPARVITPAAAYSPSEGTVALREPGTALTGRPAIDGAETLGYLYRFLSHFAVWGSDAEIVASALWICQAHAKDSDGRPVWQYSPRLGIFGPSGSGKSWKARLVGKLAPKGKILLEPTKASFIDLCADGCTGILTEADELFGTSGRNRGILAAVNAGYEPDRTAPRKLGGKVVEVPVYTPVVLDGLDTMLAESRQDLRTMITRCIILLARKAPAGYRPPRFDQQARAVAEQLSKRCAAWMAQEVLSGIAGEVPGVPEHLGNRPFALWEPLFTVALRADEGDPDGPWSQACAAACEQLEDAGGYADETAEDMSDLDNAMAGYDYGDEVA